MAGKRISTDWVGLGVIVTLLLGLGGWMLSLQAQTNNRLDRCEAKIKKRLDGIDTRLGALEARLGSLGQRVARIEGMIERSSPFAAGKRVPPGAK